MLIIKKWSNFLDKYTDLHFESRTALTISLIVFVLMIVGAIFVLNLPEKVSTNF